MLLPIIPLLMLSDVFNVNNNKGLACTVAPILFCLLVREKCVRYIAISIDKGI